MTIVSTVTISGNTYDVYGTTSELKTYMAGRLGAEAFDDATSNDRKKAHVEATRWIDREQWLSVPTDVVTPQPLEHPRVGLVDCNGTPVDDDTLGPGICEGTFELVLSLLQDPSAAASSSSGTNIKRVGAGSARVEFFQPGKDASGQQGKVFPTEAFKQLRCYLAAGTGTGGKAFGSGEESQFDDCDAFDLNQGFFG